MSKKPTGRASLRAALAELKTDLPKKRNKFSAVKTIRHGITFHSKGEADRYDELELLCRAGQISALLRQQPFGLYVKGIKLGVYVADFIYIDETTGDTVVEDFKGWRTALYRWKKKHFEAEYAPLKITETERPSRRLTRRKRSTK